MRILASLAKPRKVVFSAVCCCAALLAQGFALPAFAQVDSETGAIAGGFFAEPPISPSLQQLQIAMPTGAMAHAGNSLCETAVASASAGHQLPPGLLNAIAVVESGRLDSQTGSMKPWPWTIDANGTGYVYNTEQSAIQAAAAFEAAGTTSLDIGCLQVNLAQHPDAFQTLAQAFDPTANADYAASFLLSLNQKFGNWPQAVAAYHSQTVALGQPYAEKVYAAWQGTPGAAAHAFAAVDAGSTPAVTTGAIQPAFAMSSVAAPMTLPMQLGSMQMSRPLTGRGLAAYRASPILIARSLPPQG